ncbi:nucleoside-diphosphate kinase [Candidatus Pacearchaeota archaeon]|nr:nucleoside-diphosphate kinase [Candidatus Pacearchaeota archaeon]
MQERTLILIKPDGVVRGLIGRIIGRFEETGLKIVGMKMAWADEKLAKSHYYLDENWAKNVFEKTKSTHEKEGRQFNFKDHMEYGGMIQKWNMNFLREGPVIAAVIEGPHAIEIVRKMIGNTEPKQASPGTIRGDFAMRESYEVANTKQRVLRNLAHASDSPETANREISLWFKPEELHSYKTLHDSLAE